MTKYPLLIAALLGLSQSALADTLTSSQDVAACMRANLPRHFAVEDFVLSSRSPNGSEEVLSGQIYFSRETRQKGLGPARAMMHIENPAPLRDAAYLLFETDDYMRDGMFVFLPAMNRVRRVSGTLADGQLFGTDISYYDFKQFRTAMGDMDASDMQPGLFNGRRVYQLRFTPKDPQASPYEFVDAQIDAQSCLPLQLRIHEQGHLKKILSIPVDAIRRDGERWYPAEFTIHDQLNNSSSTLRTTSYDSATPPAEKLFHPSTFYR